MFIYLVMGFLFTNEQEGLFKNVSRQQRSQSFYFPSSDLSKILYTMLSHEIILIFSH